MDANKRESWIGKNTCACLGLAVLLVAGCTSLRFKEPDWVRNPKTVYPESSYLVAVGEGDTRRAAENAADANLARIFESHIESDERVIDKVSESDRDFSRTTDLTTDINILSSQTILNIQHAEAWKDAMGRYHAVAYLDRRDTAAIYRDNVEKLTARVEALLEYAQQADSELESYALLRAAARTAAENESLLQQLKVIHPPTASASAPPYSANEIRRAVTDAARRIRVQIEMAGDGADRLTASLEELITRYGFVVGQPAVLIISGRVEVNDTGQRTADLFFVRYEMAVQIKDTGGTVLVAISNKGREAHESKAEAEIRSFRTLERAIRAEGVQRLDAFFDALAEHSN